LILCHLKDFAMTPSNLAIAVTLTSIATSGGISAQMGTRLELTECPFAQEPWVASVKAECHWLLVPQDRNRDTVASVRLFVVVLRADRAGGKPPLVLLHGGPGVSALVPMARWARGQGPLERDFVIYDQRGAGLSEPDPCPQYASRLGDQAASEALGSTGRGILQAVARECVASMQARGIDPAAYSTVANVADLVDLRLALGYDRWDIYGLSYGARLAQEAMRRDPHGIRAVVLDKPVPPGAEGAVAPLATQRALERVFAACDRNAACHAAFPAPDQTFIEVFEALSQAPLAAGRASRRIELDGEGFVIAVRRLLRSREGITSLPLLLHELRHGDQVRAARELLRLAGAGGGDAGRATLWLVQCYDQYGPAYTARLDTVRSMVWRPLQALDNRQECPMWQTRFAAADENAPVASDIPTLVMTGEFDAATPIEFGRRIASTLSRPTCSNSRVRRTAGARWGVGPRSWRSFLRILNANLTPRA